MMGDAQIISSLGAEEWYEINANTRHFPSAFILGYTSAVYGPFHQQKTR